MSDRIATFLRTASTYSSDRWLYAWALGYAAIGAASLLVPLYALSLGGDPFIAGALEATAGLAGVPGALIWGRLADRTGQRRAFVLVSLVGTGAILLVFPLVDSMLVILFINTLLWFVVAAASPVVTLFMIEKSPEREWEARIGLLNAYQRYGWVGGLIVGTLWLGTISFRYTPLVAQRTFFYLCAAAALVAVPLAFYWLPPEATVASRRLTRSPRVINRLVVGSGRYMKLIPFVPTRTVFTLKRLRTETFFGRFPSPLRRYFLTAFVFSAAFAIFFGPAPAFLVALEYSSAFVFVFFILASLASATIFVPVGRLAGDQHPKGLQIRALGVRVLLFPAIGIVGLFPGVGLRTIGIATAFSLLGITWAVIAVTGAGLVSRSAPVQLRGEALGVYTALSGIGGGVGGLVGGYLASAFGYQVAFAFAGFIALLSVGFLLSIRFTFGTANSSIESPTDTSD